MSFQIGKAKIEITTRGCKECGAQWSRAWWVEREVMVKIGKKEIRLEIHICDDCKRTQTDSLLPLMEE